jgi:acyl-CoA synthetase (AMP-forming)/AMP-acid ligase II
MNVYEPIEFWRAAAPNRPALIFPGGFVTYGQLGSAADEAAVAISRAGFRSREAVAINVTNPVFQIVLLLALGRLNIPASFFKSAAFGPKYGLNIAGLITDVSPAPSESTGRLLKVDHNWFVSKLDSKAKVRFTPAPCAPDDIVRIAVTSGSTGTPKALSLTHANFEARLRAAASHPDSKRTLSMLPPSSSWGYLILLKLLRSGGAFCFAPFPNQALDLCESSTVNVICASVGQAATLLDEQRAAARELRSVEHLFIGGSTASQTLLEGLRKHVCRSISVGYGATETGQAASGPLGLFEQVPGAAGFKHPNVTIEIVDDQDRLLPPGQIGQVRIAGPGSAKDYALPDENGASVFRGSWFYTGDMGQFTESGVLVIEGRLTDTIINKGGFKVAASQVEDALRKELAITDAAVFASVAPDGAPQLWAAVVSEKPFDTNAAQRDLDGKLGAIAPDRIVRVESIPRSETGKILYAAIRSQLSAK